jgi:integrase
MADQIHSQLITGTYEDEERKTWVDFRAKYDEQILAGMESNSRTTAMRSLANFERVAKPRLVRSITTEAVDKFIAKRRKESGARKGTKTSPATINRNLRYLRAALRKARSWKFISDVPEFAFLREQKKIPTYVPPTHFAAIYRACDNAKQPSDLPNLNLAEWWRAIIVTAFMMGCRISQIMSLRWEDVDLENGTTSVLRMTTKASGMFFSLCTPRLWNT